MNPLPEGYELQKQYDFTCPTCGHEQFFKPSLLMHMGYNHGGGGCLNCKAYLKLRIDPDTNLGLAEPHAQEAA
jgi:transcription elongation factor Elf1